MSAIGGPGGIGGPKGPSGASGPASLDDVPDVGDARDVADIADIGAARATQAVGGLEAMAAEIAAGKLTANEAIDRLVDELCSSEQLGRAERTELREMLTDLVANDPYLKSLVGGV